MNNNTRRQAFIDICDHKTPGRIIADLGGCPLSGLSPEAEALLKDFLGYSGAQKSNPDAIDDRILNYFDIDTRGVGRILTPKNSSYKRLDGQNFIDEWGIQRTYTGEYWDIVSHPLKGATIQDLDGYFFPDPLSLDPDELDEIAAETKHLYENTDYIICASHPVYGVFELGCWMCGFDDFLMKIALEPEFVHKFFQIVLDYQIKVSQIYYQKLGGYIHYTSSGDDFATQSSTFMSVDMFKELVNPYFSERIRYTKSLTDAKFLHHSCGSVFSLIPTLIEAGVDILNPIQPTTPEMSPVSLKKAYGDKIVFHGGLDTQELLPKGSSEDIDAAVRDLIDVMTRDGGYIFAAAHNIQGDVSPESIVQVFETVKKLKL